MVATEAHVETERASRYLAQLCRHFSNLRRHDSRRGADHAHARPDVQAKVEWSETHGVVDFGWGECTMQAGPDALTLRAEAPDENSLRRVQEIVGDHVERFAQRDDLKVLWTPARSARSPKEWGASGGRSGR